MRHPSAEIEGAVERPLTHFTREILAGVARPVPYKPADRLYVILLKNGPLNGKTRPAGPVRVTGIDPISNHRDVARRMHALAGCRLYRGGNSEWLIRHGNWHGLHLRQVRGRPNVADRLQRALD